MSELAPPRAVVVGAGLAGLAAAHRLARHGVDVTVLEPARTEDEAARGPAWGVHAIPRHAPVLLGLAQELGLAERVCALPLAVEVPPASAAPGGLGPVPGLVAAGDILRSPLEALRARRLRRLLQRYAPRLDVREVERTAPLDDRSAADFCRLYLGNGPLAWRRIGLLELAFGADPAELSRVALLLLLDAWAELDASLVLGLDALRAALAQPLKDVRHGAPLSGISGDARELWLASGERIRTDAVLLTTAPAEAARCAQDLWPAERVALESLREQGDLALRVRLRAPLASAGPAPRPAVVRALVERRAGPLAGMLDATALTADAALDGGSTWLLRARASFAARAGERSPEELSGALLAAAERLQPGLLERLDGHELERSPAALPQLRVGCYRAAERLAREAARRPERPLFLALPGLAGAHAEAELTAGLRAADACLLRIRAARS